MVTPAGCQCTFGSEGAILVSEPAVEGTSALVDPASVRTTAAHLRQVADIIAAGTSEGADPLSCSVAALRSILLALTVPCTEHAVSELAELRNQMNAVQLRLYVRVEGNVSRSVSTRGWAGALHVLSVLAVPSAHRDWCSFALLDACDHVALLADELDAIGRREAIAARRSRRAHTDPTCPLLREVAVVTLH